MNTRKIRELIACLDAVLAFLFLNNNAHVNTRKIRELLKLDVGAIFPRPQPLTVKSTVVAGEVEDAADWGGLTVGAEGALVTIRPCTWRLKRRHLCHKHEAAVMN